MVRLVDVHPTPFPLGPNPMMPQSNSPPARIERLKVRNFRALQNVEFRDLQPMMVLLGPNGSGKSTVFDVFAFLAECFESGLRRAWDRRGRTRELMTRGADGPLTIEIKYCEQPGTPLITYHLSVHESGGRPVVTYECWPIWYCCTTWIRHRSSELRSPRISSTRGC